MAGIKALRKIQLGKETSAGTAVAATALWRGMGTIQNSAEPVFVEEDIGLIVPTENSYIPFLLAELEMDEIEATFEQLPYILAAGVKDVTTGAADGVGTDKIYAYPWATTSAPTVRTYTIEGGDNQQAEEMEYSFVTEFGITGKAKEGVKMSATWNGRQTTPTSFTGALTPPTVENILFNSGKLYIDAGGGTIGTTVKANTLLEMALKVKTGWTPVWTADGYTYFSFIKPVLPEITLELTFEHDATSVAEKAAWLAGTVRLIQLKFEGSTVATPGTTYSKKSLLINLAGKWQTFNKIEEQDGNDIVAGTFRASYNSGLGMLGQIIVVNELTTLP